MKNVRMLGLLGLMITLSSCSENYSNGERIGLVTQFSKTGLIWKSYEGHLNVTQTGMNSSVPFDFSLDNDRKDQRAIIETLDSAATYNWKVKIVYHEVAGYNCLNNRGHTDYFVKQVEVLDKNMTPQFGSAPPTSPAVSGRRVDTIYVVIDERKSK